MPTGMPSRAARPSRVPRRTREQSFDSGNLARRLGARPTFRLGLPLGPGAICECGGSGRPLDHPRLTQRRSLAASLPDERLRAPRRLRRGGRRRQQRQRRTAEIVKADFPQVRLIRCENRGFAHANNRALLTSQARYALFLNVDTEILEGTFGELVRALDDRPTVGLAGVLQVTPGGAVAPTMRRFPNALRSLAEGLGSEHFPFEERWLGERELDLARHRQESACDWLSGSFLVAHHEALQSAGFMDERFFLYSEEPDLGLPTKRASWEVRHLPVMTVLHHGGEYRTDPRLFAQDAYSRIQFADERRFSPRHIGRPTAARWRYGNALRAAAPGSARRGQRHAARAALRVLLGQDGPPFGSPPGQALSLRSRMGADERVAPALDPDRQLEHARARRSVPRLAAAGPAMGSLRGDRRRQRLVDGSADALERRPARSTLIRNGREPRFCGGCNQAYRRSTGRASCCC